MSVPDADRTSIVLTDDGIAGVGAATGTQRWTAAPPANCSFQQLAASGASLVALAACNASFVIVSIDPSTGKAAWQHHVTEPSSSYQFQILAASPVVISDDLGAAQQVAGVPVGARAVDFVAAGGDHDDWDEYDRVMREQGRTAVLVRPTRVYSN